MWCQKRITNQSLLARFGDGKHRFYLESVCGAKIHEGRLCESCTSIVPQTRTQDVRTFPHGYVGTEYTKESHIYDSPWYHAKAKAYGLPTTEVLEFAMEAQKKARSGRKTKTVADLMTPGMTTEVVVKKETAKKAPRKSKKEIVTTHTPISEPSTIQQITDQPNEPIITHIPIGSVFTETMDTPLEVEEVIRIMLRPFTHNSVQYWRDGHREKLYRRTKECGKGEYVGRWDSDIREIVRDAPDSDAD